MTFDDLHANLVLIISPVDIDALSDEPLSVLPPVRHKGMEADAMLAKAWPQTSPVGRSYIIRGRRNALARHSPPKHIGASSQLCRRTQNLIIAAIETTLSTTHRAYRKPRQLLKHQISWLHQTQQAFCRPIGMRQWRQMALGTTPTSPGLRLCRDRPHLHQYHRLCWCRLRLREQSHWTLNR